MSLLWNLLLHLTFCLHEIVDQVTWVLGLQIVYAALDSLQSTLSLSPTLTKLPLSRLLLLDALVNFAKFVLGRLKLSLHLLYITLAIHCEHVEALA